MQQSHSLLATAMLLVVVCGGEVQQEVKFFCFFPSWPWFLMLIIWLHDPIFLSLIIYVLLQLKLKISFLNYFDRLPHHCETLNRPITCADVPLTNYSLSRAYRLFFCMHCSKTYSSILLPFLFCSMLHDNWCLVYLRESAQPATQYVNVFIVPAA